MRAARTILRYLKKNDEYLNHFPRHEHSKYFECLVAEAFSRVLHLPFYSSANDNTTIPHRVVWQGNINPITLAPQRKPDAIAHCYNFDILIESTLKDGANQWTQEFASSARHCDDFISQREVQPNDVYIILVTPKLYQDTYRSIHQHPRQEFNFIPIEVSTLAKILETSILAFTMRHIDLRKLFHKIQRCIRESSSLADYRKSVDKLLTEWQKDVFRREKGVFIGVKSYEAMRRIERESRRKSISAYEILQKLQKHPFVTQYLKVVHDKLLGKTIENSLIQGSFAIEVGRIISSDEGLFEPIPYEDFSGRESRLIAEVEKIND